MNKDELCKFVVLEGQLEAFKTKTAQLIDHVTSGVSDTYFVYDGVGGRGSFKTYKEALAEFDIATEGWCHITLATRIGTGVVIKDKPTGNMEAVE